MVTVVVVATVVTVVVVATVVMAGRGDGSCRATVVAVVVGRCAMKTKTGNKRKEEGEVIPNSSIQEGNIEFLP